MLSMIWSFHLRINKKSSKDVSGTLRVLFDVIPHLASLSAISFPRIPLWPLTLYKSNSKHFVLQQSIICLMILLFFALNQLLILTSFQCFSIASIADLLSVYIRTLELIGAASIAVQIAPSSAWVEEGWFSILLLKLMLLLFYFLP